MIAAVLPTIAVALTILFTTRSDARRTEWAGIGFRSPTGRSLLVAVGLPIAIASLSFGVAAAIGVIQPGIPTFDGGLSGLADIGAEGGCLLAVVPGRGDRPAWRTCCRDGGLRWRPVLCTPPPIYRCC
jgi:hypothetical protein